MAVPIPAQKLVLTKMAALLVISPSLVTLPIPPMELLLPTYCQTMFPVSVFYVHSYNNGNISKFECKKASQCPVFKKNLHPYWLSAVTQPGGYCNFAHFRLSKILKLRVNLMFIGIPTYLYSYMISRYNVASVVQLVPNDFVYHAFGHEFESSEVKIF